MTGPAHEVDEIAEVGVVGAGVMGGGIAQAFAQGGVPVVCVDVGRDQLDRARTEVRDGRYGLARAAAAGHLDEDPDTVLARVRWSTDVADLAACGLVVESVPEDPAVKRRTFAAIADHVAPAAVIATNSSGLPLASLVDAVPGPERFLAWHWASPAAISRFAEIVVHETTDPAVVDRVVALARALDRDPVVVRDDPSAWGYVANRVFTAALLEAQRVVDAGLCPPDDVDRLLTRCYGWPAGPFATVRGAATGWQDGT